MEVRGNYIIFCDKDKDVTWAVKKDEVAGMYSTDGSTEIYLYGNKKPSFNVSCTIDEILSKIEDSAPRSSHKDKSDAVIDRLRKEHRALLSNFVIDQLRMDRDGLLSSLTQIRDYGQEKIDRCRNFDTDSLVNLGDIMHMTSIANEALGKDAGEDFDELIK